MDLNDCRTGYEQFLNMTDMLDKGGGGLVFLTQGKYTTKEALGKDLGLFLLSVANDFPAVSREQAELLDMVLHEGFASAPLSQVKQTAATVGEQDVMKNTSIHGYVLNDVIRSAREGRRITSTADGAVGILQLMGLGMIAVSGSPNQRAQDRVERYTAALKKRAAELVPEYEKLIRGK